MASSCLRIDVWDVGQGDCSVITLPDGALLVIDVGPSNSPFIPWIAARPHLRIECIALTHNDDDHCGALTPLLEATLGRVTKVRALAEPQRTQKQFRSLFRRAIELHGAGKINLGRLEVPTILWTDPKEDTTLDVIFPNMAEIELARSKNESSAVIRLQSKGRTLAIWPGDNILKRVAERAGGQSPQFMVGPHHGRPQDVDSKPAWSHLDQINPGQVLLSLGTENTYNHPSARYIKMAVIRGTRVTCTQITRGCDRRRAPNQRPVLDGSSRLGLLPCPTGTPCRGGMRFTLLDGSLLPDEWQAEHDARIKRLHRAMCIP